MVSLITRFLKNLLKEPSLDELDLAASEGTIAWHTNSDCKYPPGPLRDAWWAGREDAKEKAYKSDVLPPPAVEISRCAASRKRSRQPGTEHLVLRKAERGRVDARILAVTGKTDHGDLARLCDLIGNHLRDLPAQARTVLQEIA